MTRHRDPFGEEYIQEANARVAESFPKQGIWTGNQQLGAVLLNPQQEVQTIAGGASKVVNVPIGENTTLLKMDEWWFPHTWSLSLWAKNKKILPDNGAPLTTEAIIDFGVGGAMQTAEVDFARGVVLTLVANSITVRITRATPESEIFAQLAIGTRGPCGCPKRRLFRNLFIGAGGTSAIFPLPPFASQILITAGDDVPRPNMLDPLVFVDQVSALGLPAAVFQSTPLSIVTSAYGGKLDVLSDSMGVLIENTSLAAIRLNCQVDLGL